MTGKGDGMKLGWIVQGDDHNLWAWTFENTLLWSLSREIYLSLERFHWSLVTLLYYAVMSYGSFGLGPGCSWHNSGCICGRQDPGIYKTPPPCSLLCNAQFPSPSVMLAEDKAPRQRLGRHTNRIKGTSVFGYHYDFASRTWIEYLWENRRLSRGNVTSFECHRRS